MSFFKTIGIAEGVSFLVLLGIAMPLKYGLGLPVATQIAGSIHGALFIAYIVLATKFARERNWPGRVLFHAYVASVVPCGTFIFQRKYREHHA
jgi:integral membrane protein